MTRSLAVVVAFALTASLFAQTKDEPPKKEPTLKVGDPAPPLVVDKWLTGKEVKGFEKDTVYVLSFAGVSEFTFPSAMTVLSDLHDKVVGKGLVVVGVQSPNYAGTKMNEKELAKELDFKTIAVKQSGVSYPVGWEKERNLWDAYVQAVAADQPVAFVIDKAGKIAYFGPDATAAYVAGKVLDGTWKGKADIDVMAEASDGLRKFMDELGKKVAPIGKFDEKMVKALQDELPALEKRFKDTPFLQTDPQSWARRYAVHLMGQSYDVPEEMIAAKIAAAEKRKNPAVLFEPAYMLGSAPLKADPKLSKLVGKLTDAIVNLMDAKKAGADPDERVHWYAVIVLSKKYGNAELAEGYTKKLLDAAPEKDRKEIEEVIQKRLKDLIGPDK